MSAIGLIERVKRILKHPIYFLFLQAHLKMYRKKKIRKFNKRVTHPHTLTNTKSLAYERKDLKIFFKIPLQKFIEKIMTATKTLKFKI